MNGNGSAAPQFRRSVTIASELPGVNRDDRLTRGPGRPLSARAVSTTSYGSSTVSTQADPTAGRIARVTGYIAAVGIVLLLLFYVLAFATPLKDLGALLGTLNDICIAIQYLLTIPLALYLRRILRHHAPGWIEVATFVGVASMIAVAGLSTALVLGLMTFEQQVLWVTLAMIPGTGFWFVVTALVARRTGRFPNSLRMSLGAAFYLGYPWWAFWLRRQLAEP